MPAANTFGVILFGGLRRIIVKKAIRVPIANETSGTPSRIF
jgi:hypothetical protein